MSEKLLGEEELIDLFGEIWTRSEIEDNMKALTDEVGHRFAGSEGEKQAADFIAEKFREYGLSDVKEEEFQFQGWERGETKLTVSSPLEKELPAIALPYSPAASLERQLVDLGDGLEEDFQRDLEDKVVMVSSFTPSFKKRWIHRGEKYDRAVEAGAAGFLFVNHYPGNLEPTGSLRSNQMGEIPGLGLSKETGAYLTRKLQNEEEVKVRLEVEVKGGKSLSRNVSGLLTSPEVEGEGEIVFGGHYDGHDISQGAEDNAAGVAALMESARVLGKFKGRLKAPIRFLAFGAEEMGLIGSKEYVSSHDLGKIGLVINLDGPGRARDVKILTSEFSALAAEMKNFSPVGEPGPTVEDVILPHSDHWPFVKEGVPGCFAVPKKDDSGRGWGHTSADTLDKVDPRNIKENVSLLAQIVLHLSGKLDKFQRKDPQEVMERIREEDREGEIDWL